MWQPGVIDGAWGAGRVTCAGRWLIAGVMVASHGLTPVPSNMLHIWALESLC